MIKSVIEVNSVPKIGQDPKRREDGSTCRPSFECRYLSPKINKPSEKKPSETRMK